MTSAGETNLSAENRINNIQNENGSKELRGKRSKRAKKSPKGKHTSRLENTPRVLRSRAKEECEIPEPSSNLQDQSAGTSGENTRKKKKKKKTQTKDAVVDEFSRTRKHLRYLLHRMAYEQNLIDAYSGDGWKGQSAEKLRPEKELQRAKSEILRIKLKIRDLFQRIDVSITEGRLPQSLFDEEGEIDSEDIFCAKCGSKDVTLENDIILCDGACERAFHQFCVQPPLLNEDIPPDEEGWLCPGCDCKDDCIDLINDSQGTHLNILDSWEKVYPEAATVAGNQLDNLDLPSDDSEDDDFKPDESEVEEREEGDESSSDESNTNSGSEDAEVAPVNGQTLQFPSDDDSEDDDFNPDAADMDEEVKKESSGSDFTSDSEDLNALIEDNNKGSSNENKTMPNEDKPKSSKVGRGKRPLLNDESSSPLETTSVISARREVERLDYKKLYDEQYGDVPTDSSDEEFFDAVDAPKRRREHNNDTEKVPKRKASKKLDSGGANNSPMNTNKVPSELGTTCVIVKTSPLGRLGETSIQEQSRNVSTDSSNEEYFDAADAPKRRRKTNMDGIKSPKRSCCKKTNAAGAIDTPAKSNKASSEPGSSSTQAKTSAYKRLGEAATEGLLLSFKENHYPERATKEKLAVDLGITTHQVAKWFENARHSYRHSPHLESKLADIPSKGIPPKIISSHNRLNIPVDDLKNGDQSEDTKDPTISAEIQQKVMNRGTCNGKESACLISNKSSTNVLSNNFPSDEDALKSCGSVEVSKTPEKKTRGRRKKSNT